MNKTQENIIKKLVALINRYPFLRIGQLIINAIRCEYGDRDLFYVADKELFLALNNYPKNIAPNSYISSYNSSLSVCVNSYTTNNSTLSKCCQSLIVLKILVNKAKCLICGEVLESKTVHDFKTCKCGNLSVDGGKDYLKRCAKDFTKVEELNIVKYICSRCRREV